MTDGTLRSDYFFLEEVLDQMPRARKISKMEEHDDVGNTRNKSHNNKKYQATNKKSRKLVQQAEKRGITLRILPPFMERHKTNSSWFCSPRDMITWKVECVLVPGSQIISFNLSETEDAILESVLKHVPKEGNDDVPKTQGDLKLFLKRPSPANQPRYVELDPNTCLQKALEGLTILEHPTIFCVPNDASCLKDFPTGTTLLVEQENDTSVKMAED
ncbi:MAG: hypothetical protein SGILL_003670 [Bacillariaceae sp.]